MKQVKTPSGFNAEIYDEALNDMELFDCLKTMESGNDAEKLFAASEVAERLLGKDGKKALYDHIRDENGRVKTESFIYEIRDIFEGLKAKN